MIIAPLLLTLFAPVSLPSPGGPAPVVAQPVPRPQPASPLAYADAIDLTLDAPLVIDATIRSAARLKGADAASAPPGTTRFYVTADVAALIRGSDAIPQRIGYVYDAPLNPSGRLPNYKKARVILFARSTRVGADQVQLVAKDAQFAWSPALDTLVRRTVHDVAAADAAPVVTGLAKAFHVPGALPGEGETQIFLNTASGRPVSLSVLRRPGEQPRWAVALSEIVDDAAGPPRRDTLLWYRLACGLPPALPPASSVGEQPEDAAAAREDYRFVLGQLGPCTRIRTGG